MEKLLIGNKCDWEARRVVSKEKGESLAQSQKIPFLETSAKTNYNIDESFEKLAQLILKKVNYNTSVCQLYANCIKQCLIQSAETSHNCITIHVHSQRDAARATFL